MEVQFRERSERKTFRVPSPTVLYGRASTRGNNYKLVDHSFHYDLRKQFFSARIVNIWISLPNSVVDASTVNAFKARLDKFRSHQAVT